MVRAAPWATVVLPVHADRLQRPPPVVVTAVDELDELDERGIGRGLGRWRNMPAVRRIARTLGMGHES